MNIMHPRKKERFASYSHLFGLVLALTGGIVLIILSKDDLATLSVVIIYTICMCFMFTASTLYHASKKTDNDQSFWRKLDHIAIYFMIAGSYTIMSFLYLDGNFRIAIISLQWIFASVGTVFKIFTINVPSWIDVGIYLVMGWMIAVRMDYMIREFPIRIFVLVLLGGLAYTIGAILHALNKPFPIPNKFEFHDIFHVLIIGGAGFHYMAVLYALI